jgi:type I restriction enzyme, S subunit
MSKWEMVRLGEVFRYIKNGASIKQGVSGGYPITRIETISKCIVDRSKMGYAGIEDVSQYKNYILEHGDILMSHINSEKHLGKTACYERECGELIIHGMNLLCLKVTPELVYFKFANYFFCSQLFKRQIPQITKKSVNQASFTVTALKDLQIPLPPLEVQKKIAQTLDVASELIVLRKKQITELDNLIKSTFYDMFGDPVVNEKGWKNVKLGLVGNWRSGGTPLRSKTEYFQGNIPWYSSGELESMYVNKSVECISKDALEQTSAKVIEPESLLLGMYDTAALKSSITIRECSCNQAIAFAKLNSKLCNTIFVYYTIQIARDYYKRLQRGVRQQNMNLSMIKDTEIILPPLPLQTQFAEIVTKIEEQKALVQKAIDESQYLFDSLMSQYFE